MLLFVDSMLYLADSGALFVNTCQHQPGSLCYFIGAHVCFAGAIAGFADAVLRRPGDDLRRRGKHDVFTNYSHRF